MPTRTDTPAATRPARSLSDRHRERMLFRRYRSTRDAATRELIVARYMGLATSVAARYGRSSVPHDDRVQIACIGLLKAIDRFDADRGIAFSSFAVPTMLGELQRYFRDHTWTVRPPRDLQDRVVRLDRTAEALGADLGRAPTAAELATATGLPVEEVLECLQAARGRTGSSLDQPAGPEQEDGLAATIGADDPRFGQVEDGVVADDLLAALTPREALVLRLRFERDMTQSEIGAVVGCSQMQVSRIIRGALEHLAELRAGERAQLLSIA